VPRPVRAPFALLAAATAAACVALVPARARAQAATPAARLLYTQGQGAEACIDAAALREAVTMRLGYDPFRADAPATVEARVAATAKGLRADVRLFDAAGALVGERELSSPGTDCAALGNALTLTISILVDPRSLTRTPSAAPSPPSPPPPAEAKPGTTFDAADVHDSPFEHAPPPPPPREPTRLRAGLAGVASTGSAPALSVGVAVLVGLERRPWALDLEGRADLPASSMESDGSGVGSSLLLAGLVPCYVTGPLRLCVPAFLGSLRGEGLGVATPDRAQSFYAAAGARVAVEPELGSGFLLRAYAEGTAPLVHTTLRAVGHQAVWTTPAISLSLGLGVGKRFP
jgi:hypothetical protein